MDELEEIRPDYFLPIAWGCIFGIAGESLLRFGASFALVFVCIAVLLFLWRQREMPVLVFVFLLAIAGGVMRADVWLNARRAAQENVPLGVVTRVKGTVSSLPEAREKDVTYQFKTEEGYLFRVFAPLYPPAFFGDTVEMDTELRLPKREGTEWIAEAALPKKYAITPCVERCGVMAGALRFRRALIDQIRGLFPEPYGSLGVGILAGKDSMPEKLNDTFRVAGVSHVVVLSGYNVSIVSRVLGEGYLGILAVLFFVVGTGAEPSVIRAGIMTALVVAAKKWGREYDVGRALLAAAFCMAMVNPRLLLYDLSFQLSFLATVGIVYFYPILILSFRALPERFLVRESVALTSAAQIAVLPLILYRFGELSLVSLLTNVLLVPLVPYAMAAVLLAAVISFVVPSLSIVASMVGFPLLWCLVKGAELFAQIPYASVSITGFSLAWCVFSYVFIGVWFVSVRKKIDESPNGHESDGKRYEGRDGLS